MNLQALLWRCTQDALVALGEPTMQSIAWHMDKVGVSVTPENFDVRKFDAALKVLMGEGANVIMDLVAQKMAKELGLDATFKNGLSGLDRVLKVLETAKETDYR